MPASRGARLLGAALVVMFELSLALPRVHAQVEEVKITVEGMTCNLCAAGLERALRRVEGVAAVKVVLAAQTATIRLKPGAAVAPAHLRAAVDSTGQILRVVELRLRGPLQRDGARYRLRPAGHSQAFAVRDAAKLESFAGKNVRLRGRVVSSDAANVELELTSVEPS